jgi:hypothetical protein
MLNQILLKKLLSYDENTGIFTWKNPIHGAVVSGKIAGYIRKDGYCQIQIDSKLYLAHRLAWLYVYGKFPNNQIDHISGARNDNRIINLREATNKQNSQNIKNANINNTHGYLGVSCNKYNYQAKIGTDGKTKHLGYFDTPELAHQAYLEAKRQLHSHNTL